MKNNINQLCVYPEDTLKIAIEKLNKCAKRTLIVVNKDLKLLGTISDGDIRKSLLKSFSISSSIKKIYQRKPSYFLENTFSKQDLNNLFIKKEITIVPIVNNNKKVVDYITLDKFLNKSKKSNLHKNVAVIIMAGGYGTRLKPFTNFLPKPLLPVDDQTVIDKILGEFIKYGFENFYISVNFKSKLLKTYINETYSNKSLNIGYIEEKQPLGTIGSVRLLSNKSFKEILVVNCDIISYFDINSFLNFHRKNKNSITLVASQKKYIYPYGICKKNKNNELQNLIEKPSTNILINVGIYILNNNIKKLIALNKKFDATDLINLAKKKKFKVGIFPISEECWSDVGQWTNFKDFIEKNE